MVSLQDLLDRCVEEGISDLHLTVGRPPSGRKHGHLVDLASEPLEPADTWRWSVKPRPSAR